VQFFRTGRIGAARSVFALVDESTRKPLRGANRCGVAARRVTRSPVTRSPAVV
jgi:hypothetical protein